MDNFNHFFNIASQYLWDANRVIAEPILNMPTLWILWVALIPTTFLLIGRRLSVIGKPDRPYLSPSIVYISEWNNLTNNYLFWCY